jgi:hypothetical protein
VPPLRRKFIELWREDGCAIQHGVCLPPVMNLMLKQMQQKPVHPLMLSTRATMHLNNAL